MLARIQDLDVLLRHCCSGSGGPPDQGTKTPWVSEELVVARVESPRRGRRRRPDVRQLPVFRLPSLASAGHERVRGLLTAQFDPAATAVGAHGIVTARGPGGGGSRPPSAAYPFHLSVIRMTVVTPTARCSPRGSVNAGDVRGPAPDVADARSESGHPCSHPCDREPHRTDEAGVAPFASSVPTVRLLDAWTGGLQDRIASGAHARGWRPAHGAYAITNAARRGSRPSAAEAGHHGCQLGRLSIRRVVGQPRLAAAVGRVHRVDLAIAVALAAEGDLGAVRRPGRLGVVAACCW